MYHLQYTCHLKYTCCLQYICQLQYTYCLLHLSPAVNMSPVVHVSPAVHLSPKVHLLSAVYMSPAVHLLPAVHLSPVNCSTHDTCSTHASYSTPVTCGTPVTYILANLFLAGEKQSTAAWAVVQPYRGGTSIVTRCCLHSDSCTTCHLPRPPPAAGGWCPASTATPCYRWAHLSQVTPGPGWTAGGAPVSVWLQRCGLWGLWYQATQEQVSTTPGSTPHLPLQAGLSQEGVQGQEAGAGVPS